MNDSRHSPRRPPVDSPARWRFPPYDGGEKSKSSKDLHCVSQSDFKICRNFNRHASLPSDFLCVLTSLPHVVVCCDWRSGCIHNHEPPAADSDLPFLNCAHHSPRCLWSYPLQAFVLLDSLPLPLQLGSFASTLATSQRFPPPVLMPIEIYCPLLSPVELTSTGKPAIA